MNMDRELLASQLPAKTSLAHKLFRFSGKQDIGQDVVGTLLEEDALQSPTRFKARRFSRPDAFRRLSRHDKCPTLFKAGRFCGLEACQDTSLELVKA